MCGVTGYIGDSNQSVLKAMNKSLHHRGPDDEAFHFDRDLGLGHRRLSIIDLSPDARQPISNEDDSVWLVFNGEIYNFDDLRTELRTKGVVFRSHSDTEVILAAYRIWGLNCLSRLNGMFAFAIWDTQNKEMFVFRDRVGIKPLFFFKDNGHLVFGSSLSSFSILPFIDFEVDKFNFIRQLKYGYVPAPYTIIKNINKLVKIDKGV